MDRVRDIMTSHPIQVTPDTPLAVCAARLTEHSYRYLPVVDNGTLVGIISDADTFAHGVLVDDALWFQFAPDGPTLAKEITTPALTIGADQDLAGALKKMNGRGAAVVVDANTVVGVLSEHGVVRVASTLLSPTLKLSVIASAPVHTVSPHATADKTLARMHMLGVRHLIVTEDDVATGVISLRDIVTNWRGAETEVKALASTRLHTLTAEATAIQATDLLANRDIGCIPVLDASCKPTHIVTRADVMDAVATALEEYALFSGAE